MGKTMNTTATQDSKTTLQKPENLKRGALQNVQINLGNLCNQTCVHCHIGASPSGKSNMSAETARKIMQKGAQLSVQNFEFTGGAPEMNPNLKEFIEFFSGLGKSLTVRTNLTILADPRYSQFIDLYQKHQVKLVASLPAVDEKITDVQRGEGVYDSTIDVMQKLNEIGYGTSLQLDLVSNPPEGTLPMPQAELEKYFKNRLFQKHGVSFNNLIALTNNPIKRHKKSLQSSGVLEKYMALLAQKYNPVTLDSLMCRSLVSVNYDGSVYDCDFSLAERNPVEGYEDQKFWEIDFDNFSPEISWFDYCHACTAAEGSSCHGVLAGRDDGARSAQADPISNEAHAKGNGSDVGKKVTIETLDYKHNAEHYYGETIQKTADLVTAACCDPSAVPEYLKPILAMIEPEITEKYYGCGSPLPHALEEQKVLDLGCGTGRDIYIASKLAGEEGFAAGIDMTKNQVEVAQRYVETMTRRYGYQSSNVKFIHDQIEEIDAHFEKESLDVVISNCVLNLLEDKEAVLHKVFDLLKYGGELYFSDVYADRRLSPQIKNHQVLHGECLGGAMYTNDFIRAARRAGFIDPRVMNSREIEITDPAIKQLTENARFYSVTYRLWKLENLEEKCEDYGHVAIYKGGLLESPFSFELDGSHVFEKNKPERVCGNTALMVSATRFAKYFEVIGSFDEHFGEFTSCATPGSDEPDMAGVDCGC